MIVQGAYIYIHITNIYEQIRQLRSRITLYIYIGTYVLRCRQIYMTCYCAMILS